MRKISLLFAFLLSVSAMSAVISDVREITNNQVQMTGTGALLVPKGNNSARPASPVEGMFRFNTDLGYFEFYEGGAWVSSVDKNEYLDGSFRLLNTADPTKKAGFDLSNITAATTRSYVLQDADGTIPLLESDQSFTGTNTFTNNVLMVGSGAFQMPAGTTAERPLTPVLGFQRYNTDLSIPEIYDGVSWVPLSAATSIVGPVSSTDNAIVRYDGTTGKLSQDSTVLIDDDGRISPTTMNGSTYLGNNAGSNDDLSNNNNIGVGDSALSSVTTGENNIAVGYQAGTSVTTGINNIAIGVNANQANVTGSNNIAIGTNSLNDATGDNNIAVGNLSQALQTTGSGNVSLGNEALENNLAGQDNVAVGSKAGTSARGDDNVFVGANAGGLETAGLIHRSVIIGANAGDDVTTGTDNILIGNTADTANPSDSFKLNIGDTIYGDLATDSIGIGVASPTAELDVAGSGKFSGNLDVTGNASALTLTTVGDAYIGGLGAIRVPVGTTAERPAVGEPGQVRLNTDNNKFEGYDSLGWVGLGGPGTGDVLGPPLGATDNAVARYDSASGKMIQDSGVIIDDADNMSGVQALDATKLTVTSTTESSTPCPAMDEADRDLLTPATGSCVYNNDALTMQIWNGFAWVSAGGSAVISEWTTGSLYPAGAFIYTTPDYKIYLSNVTHTAGATFAGDIANWDELSDDMNRLFAATDNAIPRFDGTSGDDVQDSGVLIDDTNNITGVNDLTAGNNIVATNNVTANNNLISLVDTVVGNDLSVTNNISTATLSTTGTASIQDLDVVTNIDTATISTTGTADLNDLNVVTNTDTASLNVTGTATVNDLDVTTNIDTATLSTTGTASLNDLVVGTNATINDLDVTTNIDVDTLITTGTATINDLDVTTNVDAATVVTTGDITVNSGTSQELNVGEEILEQASTGVAQPNGLVINGGDNTKYDILATEGRIVDPTLGTYVNISYAGSTGNTPATANGITYVFLDNTSAIHTQTTQPTGADLREKLYLGRVVAIGGIVVQVLDEPVVVENIASSFYDLSKAIRIFNENGNLFTANGTNLNLNKSAGKVFSVGSNYVTDRNEPHRVSVSACTSCTFAYFTQIAGSTQPDTTVVDPANYDVAGTITAVGGGTNSSTIQRVYLFPSGNIRIAYGQEVYSNLTGAIAGANSQTFIDNPLIFGNGILVALIAVKKSATDLSDTSQARILYTSRFGESAVGAAGQSISNLQDVYNNSVTPEILLDSTRNGISFRDAAVPIGSPLFEVLSNDALTTYLEVSADQITSTNLDVGGRLEVLSTTQASAPCPVMTEAQRDLIASPIQGDCVYNSDTNNVNYYDGTGWILGLPDQVGEAGNFLYTNGSEATWQDVDQYLNRVKDNLIACASFEGCGPTGTVTVGAGVDLSGTTTRTAQVAADNVSKYNITQSAAGTINYKETVTQDFANADMTAFCEIKTTTAGVTFNVGANGVEQNSTPVEATGVWKYYRLTFTGGNTSQYYEVDYAGAGTPSIDIDNCYLGKTDNVAAGSGEGGGINFISNYTIDDDANGWNAYADAAGTAPVDCTGGSPSSFVTRNTSTPIRGSGDLQFTKDASNVQGEGFSYDFTIGNGYQSSMITTVFKSDSTATGIDDGDIKFFIYDVTNAKLVGDTAGYDLKAGSPSQIFQWQASPDSTSYRFCAHVATTEADLWEYYTDDYSVNERPIAKAPVVGDWKPYTPTVENFTYSSIEFEYRRVGDSVEIRGKAFLNAAATGTIGVGMPAGLKIANDSGSNMLGASHAIVGSTAYDGEIVSGSWTGSSTYTDDGFIFLTNSGTTANVWQAAIPASWASGSELRVVSFKSKVVGWSSNAQTSEDLGGRAVNLTARGANAIVNNGSYIPFNASIDEDSTASYDGTTITISETGRYSFDGGLGLTATGAIEVIALVTRAAGGTDTYLMGYQASDILLNLNATITLYKGDTVVFQNNSGRQITQSASTTYNHMSMTKIGNDQTMLQTEAVYARYTSNAGGAIGASFTTLIYEDVDPDVGDSHNAYNVANGQYTIPVTGCYDVDTGWISNGESIALGGVIQTALYVNGVLRNQTRDISEDTNTLNHPSYYSDFHCFKRGDIVDMRGLMSTAGNMINVGSYNWFSIRRIK